MFDFIKDENARVYWEIIALCITIIGSAIGGITYTKRKNKINKSNKIGNIKNSKGVNINQKND